MKILKLKKENPSLKKILIVVGLGLILGYVMWPMENETEFVATGAEAEETAIDAAPSANAQVDKDGSTTSVRELPSIDVSFLIKNNPFLSSATRNRNREAEIAKQLLDQKLALPKDMVSDSDSGASQTPIVIADQLALQTAGQPVEGDEDPDLNEHPEGAQLALIPDQEDPAALAADDSDQDLANQPLPPPQLTIQAIVTSQRQPAALINNRIYFENDPLNSEWRIQSIFPNRVLLAPILNHSP
jgi:hypothetical protein